MSSYKTPKINCDLGEGNSKEEEIFPLIDCASIACGGHFGDEFTIESSLLFAKGNSVKVGAHPSYHDRANFGRKSMQLDFADLSASLLQQIGLFSSVARTMELPMDHIKFHGALYNDAMANAVLAQNLCKWLSTHFRQIPIFVSAGSQMLFWAEQYGLKIRLEVFGDRAYQADYKLLPRNEPNSLFTTLSQVEEHLRSIIENQQILVNSEIRLPVQADTLCFHGDNPGLMNFLPIIREKYWK